MSIVYNNKQIQHAYYGDTPIRQIYLGDRLKWTDLYLEGLVFYAPLISSISTTTGHTLTNADGVYFDSVGGVSSAIFSGSNSLDFTPTGFPEGSEARSVSLWFRSNDGDPAPGVFGYGYDGSTNGVNFMIFGKSGYISASTFGSVNDITSTATIASGVWIHVVVTVSSSKEVVIYADGVSVGSGSFSAMTTGVNSGRIGGSTETRRRFNGAITRIRVFDYVLPEDTVAILSKEITPSS